jgi:hypothetical protein
LSRASNEELHRAATVAPDVNLALENQDHSICRSAFFKEDVAGLANDLLTMMGKPEAIFEGQALERHNTIDRSRNRFRRRRTGWGAYS